MIRVIDSAVQLRVRWIGFAGLAPLVVGSLMLFNNDLQVTAGEIITSYTAVILAFVGAIHWGRGLYTAEPGLFLLSVLPTMLAFSCLLISPLFAWPLLCAGFVSLMLFDMNEYSEQAWFRRLRMRLTMIVCGLLMLDWFWLAFWQQA